jgi:hypothetical protein
MAGLGIALTLASLGAQAFGAYQSAKANNAIKDSLQNKSDRLDAVFNKEYNMDYMATPAVSNTMAAYANALKNVNKNIQGQAVMAGQSPEAVIAEREKVNQNLGDFTRKVASGADAYKLNREQMYVTRRDRLDDQILQNQKERASQWNNLMSNAANLGVAGISAGAIQGNSPSGAKLTRLLKMGTVPIQK